MADEKKVGPAPPSNQAPMVYPNNPVIVHQVVVANPPTPPSYVLLSWISCLFCFPMGIVAILKANDSDRCAQIGNVQGAWTNGQVAKAWATAAFITGAVIMVFGAIGIAVVIAAVASVAGP